MTSSRSVSRTSHSTSPSRAMDLKLPLLILATVQATGSRPPPRTTAPEGVRAVAFAVVQGGEGPQNVPASTVGCHARATKDP